MKITVLFPVVAILLHLLVSVVEVGAKPNKILKKQDMPDKQFQLTSRFQDGIIEDTDGESPYLMYVTGYLITTTRQLLTTSTTELEYRKCTGSLITPCWTLTSAMCYFYPDLLSDMQSFVYVIRGGYTDEDTPDENIQYINATTCDAYVHPFYDEMNRDFNVLLLNACFRIDNFVKPIPVHDIVPRDTIDELLDYEDEDAFFMVYGFGSASGNGDVMSYAGVLFSQDFEDCLSEIPDMPLSNGCAQIVGLLNEPLVCSGDVGGPLVVHLPLTGANTIVMLVGVVSFPPSREYDAACGNISYEDDNDQTVNLFTFEDMESISDWVWNTIQKCDSQCCNNDKTHKNILGI
ncbi:urokinase-type plasminogen activator-like [Phlebotomus papatasi]|uniref:urokinase-type plasminogen activator-like n=1 Tax=Phlebotomus papatasi TaxID=29031 RepID=UPI0024840A3F|nr:urokinase-type plasminogen activator-like [Phlebotomus papatasi]